MFKIIEKKLILFDFYRLFLNGVKLVCQQTQIDYTFMIIKRNPKILRPINSKHNSYKYKSLLNCF